MPTAIQLQFSLRFGSVNTIDVDSFRIQCASGECEFNSHSNRIKCEKALKDKIVAIMLFVQSHWSPDTKLIVVPASKWQNHFLSGYMYSYWFSFQISCCCRVIQVRFLSAIQNASSDLEAVHTKHIIQPSLSPPTPLSCERILCTYSHGLDSFRSGVTESHNFRHFPSW